MLNRLQKEESDDFVAGWFRRAIAARTGIWAAAVRFHRESFVVGEEVRLSSIVDCLRQLSNRKEG